MDEIAADRPRSSRNRTLTTLLKLAFSIAVLIFVFTSNKTSLDGILKVLKNVNFSWLALAFSLHAVGLLCSAYRWQILARAQGDIIPLGFLMKSYLVGTFFNNFLPSSFGGDIVRIWDGSRYSRSLVKSSAIVIVERLTGVLVLFIFALLASLLRWNMANEIPVIKLSLIIGALGIGAGALFLSPIADRLIRGIPGRGVLRRLKEKGLLFRETILQYRHHKKSFLMASFWAFLLQANVVVYFIFIGKGFGLDIRILDYFIFVPIILLVQIIPVTINGFGLREGSAVEIFKYYAIAPEIAIAFSLIDVGFRMILGVAGGIVYVLRK